MSVPLLQKAAHSDQVRTVPIRRVFAVNLKECQIRYFISLQESDTFEILPPAITDSPTSFFEDSGGALGGLPPQNLAFREIAHHRNHLIGAIDITLEKPGEKGGGFGVARFEYMVEPHSDELHARVESIMA